MKGKIWFKPDPAVVAANLGTSRERIISALDWLGEQRLLEVKIAGIRHRYRIVQQPESSESLTAELQQRFHEREQAELKRLLQVLDLVALNGCQTNVLAAHFGEQHQHPCKHCSGCIKNSSKIPPHWATRQGGELENSFW